MHAVPTEIPMGALLHSAVSTAEPALSASSFKGTFPHPINPSDKPDWNDLVMAHSGGSFFHGAAWAKTLEESYGFTPLYISNEQGVGHSSILPLMEVNSWLTGRRGVALPFTDTCEPLTTDPDTMRNLIRFVLELGHRRGWKYVEWRGGQDYFGNTPASVTFYGHSVNLDADENQLFTRLDCSVRQAVRKATKCGVRTVISRSREAIETFYRLQCLTRRRHGLPPQPLGFFKNVHRHILDRKQGVVVIASTGNHPIAASIYFQLGRQAIYKYGASDEAYQNLRAVNLVMWEAMLWHAQNGAKSLHLGRTSIENAGLRRFKLGWGATEHPIVYYKYDLQKKTFVTETDESTGWHNGIFRALPLKVFKLVGSALYRHWD